MRLRHKMDRRLLLSFLYLINVAEKGLNRSYKNVIAHIENSEIKIGENRLNCYAYATHTALKNSILKNDACKVNSILEKTNKINMITKNMECTSFPFKNPEKPECEFLIETLENEHIYTYNMIFDGHRPKETDFKKSHDIFAKTVELIKILDAESYEEINELISHIFLMESSILDAGTSFPAYGCVYLSTLKYDQNWTAYLEHIIHEAAHHYLFSLWTEYQIIEEDSKKYMSPLRKEPRPISAIFHQMFVLSRVIRIMRIFKKNYLYSNDIEQMKTQYRNESVSGSFENKFEFSANIIERNAKLTDTGLSLLNSCKELVESFK